MGEREEGREGWGGRGEGEGEGGVLAFERHATDECPTVECPEMSNCSGGGRVVLIRFRSQANAMIL